MAGGRVVSIASFSFSPSGGIYAGGGVSAGRLYGELGALMEPSGDDGKVLTGEYTPGDCEPLYGEVGLP